MTHKLNKKFFDKDFMIFIPLTITIVFLVNCSIASNPAAHTPNENGDIAGFLVGGWHGFILPCMYIISLFTKYANSYEVHNNGIWYNSGFALGCAIFFQFIRFLRNSKFR